MHPPTGLTTGPGSAFGVGAARALSTAVSPPFGVIETLVCQGLWESDVVPAKNRDRAGSEPHLGVQVPGQGSPVG